MGKFSRTNSTTADTTCVMLNGCWHTGQIGRGEPTDDNSTTTHTQKQGLERRNAAGTRCADGRITKHVECRGRQDKAEPCDTHWYEIATMFCRMDDGVSEELYKLETSNRVARLKALGNAIVPQVAYIIFEAIKQYESLNDP